jgi:hypothetical protein
MSTIYGLSIKTAGMSQFCDITASGRSFTLMPPGGVGRQTWVLKKASGKLIGASKIRTFPKAIAWALEKIETSIINET